MNSIYQLHKYCDSNGTFDYSQYRKTQIAGNKKKLDRVFVKKENIEFLSNSLLSRLGSITFGICHGTRRGMEQAWFKEFTNAEVIGTEISDTAHQFPHTIQWDFHEVKPEWFGACDFIYSNSLDHSYNPELCLSQWCKCLKPNGICIIEHTSRHEKANKLDPFGAPIEVMPYLICLWGQGKFFTTDILNSPLLNSNFHTNFLFIKNKSD